MGRKCEGMKEVKRRERKMRKYWKERKGRSEGKREQKRKEESEK